MLTDLLRDEGYGVVAVSTVEDALREVSGDRHVELALLDHWLPDGTGAELCRFLKASTARAMPCLMFSASPANEALARRAGADAWLPKPFDLEGLLDSVARLSARPDRPRARD